MDINKFITSRPFLYHLTAKENIDIIKANKKLLSTKRIIESSDLNNEEKGKLLRNRRPTHVKINHTTGSIWIRDQKPLLLGSLKKCLINMSNEDYIELLNSRVFFWPSLHRLNIHYNTYIAENPIIIKCKTENCFNINNTPLFSNINTGATRCVPYYRGAAPRGKKTFLDAGSYHHIPSSVAEVTFMNECLLPETIWISNNPNNDWEEVNLI